MSADPALWPASPLDWVCGIALVLMIGVLAIASALAERPQRTNKAREKRDNQE